MARQHGYFVLIPAFIPVDKKSLQNQIQTGTVIHEAAQTQDLAAIMALPGIRYHAQKGRDGEVKEMAARWGSVEVEAEPGEKTAPEEGCRNEPPIGDEPAPDLDAASGNGTETPADEPNSTQDAATTTGRRSRAKAA